MKIAKTLFLVTFISSWAVAEDCNNALAGYHRKLFNIENDITQAVEMQMNVLSSNATDSDYSQMIELCKRHKENRAGTNFAATLKQHLESWIKKNQPRWDGVKNTLETRMGYKIELDLEKFQLRATRDLTEGNRDQGFQQIQHEYGICEFSARTKIKVHPNPGTKEGNEVSSNTYVSMHLPDSCQYHTFSYLDFLREKGALRNEQPSDEVRLQRTKARQQQPTGGPAKQVGQ